MPWIHPIIGSMRQGKQVSATASVEQTIEPTTHS
jgi:hypothetical protein